MRPVTAAGLALIKGCESFSPTVYFCPAGYPTVGYGHVVLDGERERFADGINEDEAEEMLRRDASIAERAVLLEAVDATVPKSSCVSAAPAAVRLAPSYAPLFVR